MRSERGQASVEWTGVVLVVALGLAAAVAFVPAVDGRSLGAELARRIACAVRGGCQPGQSELVAAYGEEGADLVRKYAPNIVYEPGTYTLPIDFRHCREHLCSDAPDDRDLDVHRSARGGVPATVFTHVVRRDGETFLQYWFYYPDSNTTQPGVRTAWKYVPAARLATRVATGSWEYPGWHADDWESYHVRIGRDGRAQVRASSHHDYQGCKQRRCRNTWTDWTGWTRVSRGSHAGHIPLESKRTSTSFTGGWPPLRSTYRYRPRYPGRDMRERTSTAPGLRLVPLERVDPREYRAIDPRHKPPWLKKVYRDPLSNSTG